MTKILIVDDHAVVREGLKLILSETRDMAVTGEASNGEEALAKAMGDDYDLVVLDISMPGKSGLDVLRELRRKKPKVPVLMLSIHPEEQYAVRSIRAGASGYLTKESAPDQLVAAIRVIASGGKYVPPSLAQRIASEIAVDARKPRHDVLSDREYEVMLMIASGTGINEIAQRMFLSPKTISTYRARILNKMRMKNNAELARYALKHGLVD